MALTRCAALEVVDDNIRINAVAPSLAINPHLAKTSSVELIDSLTQKEAFSRGAHPWEIANIILFLASNLSSYMTGETISASSSKSLMEKIAIQLWKKMILMKMSSKTS